MRKYRLTGIKTNTDVPMEELPLHVARITGIRPEEITGFEVRRKSIDSRRKPYIQFVYTVDFVTRKKPKHSRISGLSLVEEEDRPAPPSSGESLLEGRPVIVGMGPCGIFAGLELAKLGYRPIIIERGPEMKDRVKAVERFRRERLLDPEANMLFGEGGAGTFSDGKIGTGIKDGLIREVLSEFRNAGAGDDIMYLAKPHIGTDVLRTVIVNMRKKIEEAGGEIRFNTRLESLILENGWLKGIKVSRVRRDQQLQSDSQNRNSRPMSDSRFDIVESAKNSNLHANGDDDEYIIVTNALILAIGHSARDTFEMLRDTGLEMQQKPFSIGVRMEHPQVMIDSAQYGEENVGKLPPADYRLSYKATNGRGVYSFCMCPGGEVVVCTTKDGEICVNGMSNRKRDSGTANSGMLCDVRTEDFGSDDVLAGVRFQEKYERLAFINGGGGFIPPSCSMEEFLSGEGDDARKVIGSLPEFAVEALREAVPDFGRKIRGFDDGRSVVKAVETRSSSPVRIVRGDKGESSIGGIYPAGEGAGYAGGITSAACDGIRAAWNIVRRFAKPV